MTITKNSMQNKDLKKRILDISYKKGLSHIGSCITAVDIIKEIYDTKKKDEKFVLSAGHAGLALYVCIEEATGKNAEEIFDHHGVHPDRCSDCGINCSAGSLGHGLGIAVGMALSDRSKNVYCLISDGECAEGSISESMMISQDQKLSNLKIYLNKNNWSAYKQPSMYINDIWLTLTLYGMGDVPLLDIRNTNMNGWPDWLQQLKAHYVTMDEKMYKEALECLE